MTVDQLIETIKKSPQHRYLYHFTDEANFPSISQKGLVSKAIMREEGWWVRLHKSNGMDGSFPLALNGLTPMEYLRMTQAEAA